MSNREFTQKIEERYLGQSIHEFLSMGGDIDEYARLVFAREVFGPDVDPRDEELGIETEQDLTAALEQLAGPITIATVDPNERGLITRAGVEIDEVRFDFYSEDRSEWERLADERLQEAGYRRVSAWADTDLGNTATVTRL